MSKNIIICLDGTGNQPGPDPSNIVKLYRMLRRESDKQITYYDAGVGTMGDQGLKTKIARKINKWLGLAFGRGLMKNVMEAYTFLMDQYEDGDKVFIFGFSRGAYTARTLAAFIKECGLLEKGAYGLFPYAMKFFHEKSPEGDRKAIADFNKIRSTFRSTYGRLLKDPNDPENSKKSSYQLRIHFLGLFDTVKSYGSFKNPVIFRNEETNPSVRTLRHAISIDEQRQYFPQMHWKASAKRSQDCKEVWFAGVHSDIGGGYPEPESGLAKITLEWMCHEAVLGGLLVDPKRYGEILQKQGDGLGNWIPKNYIKKYAHPDPSATIHDSLVKGWRLAQLIPHTRESWEESHHMRTIKSEQERTGTKKDLNPVRIHQSVLDRIDAGIGYSPKNFIKLFQSGDYQIEQTLALSDPELSEKFPSPPTFEISQNLTLSEEELKKIIEFKNPKDGKVTLSPQWQVYQDAFIFSYYVRGLRFVDISNLAWKDFDGKNINACIDSDEIIEIPVSAKGREILKKYKVDNPSPTDKIFPILEAEDWEPELFQNRILSKNISANKDLTIIGNAIGIPDSKRISFHTARLTWENNASK